jgi:hypothetical protein
VERSLKCPTCGEAVASDARFCPSCGFHLEGPTDPERHAVERKAPVPTLTRNPIERRQTRKVKPVKRKR